MQGNRREWLRRAAITAAYACLPGTRLPAEALERAEGCTLSIGTYSLKGISVEDAVRLVAEIGYDGIEISVQTGFDGEPTKLTPSRREEVRRRLEGTGLKLTALMEQLTPAADDRQHKDDLVRLRGVVDLAHELGPETPPLVQTVLGGGKWDEKKALFRDRLGDWGRVFEESGLVLAIKPHRGGAMSRPEEAIWLIEQLGRPGWLRMVYDYSHYAFRDMPVEATVRTALPFTAHIAVKDAVEPGVRSSLSHPARARPSTTPDCFVSSSMGGIEAIFAARSARWFPGGPATIRSPRRNLVIGICPERLPTARYRA